ncbi:FMRFamide receptor [Condylostylus longicornis]|uniref:FMRFamide receptor n=1 Tax=Condylostylus longicornis TaxID=2530218 RepID=UPI00244DDB88|nr:FMRFamide receptor [Condylostylus longicornis]
MYGSVSDANSRCQIDFSDQEFARFEFWICGVILNFVGLLGILGNILSMIILSRPQMRSSINYLLIGLARCDTVLIITSILLFGIPSIYPYTGYLFYYYYYIYPNISPCMFPLAMAAQTSSVYMTFTVTLERYVAVCHPLKARALCTYGRAKIYFIICILFAFLYNIPRFWEVIVITNDNDNDNNVIFCVIASSLRRNDQYINIYIHWCYLIFIYFIPFLSLAILNCLIYRQVQKANRERQRLSRTERREIGLATMLLCVVIVFFLLNFLALYTNILEAFYGIIDDYLIKISNLLVTINSSANFIIYVIFGEKFKRIFLLLFCKGRISRDQPDLIHYESSISNGEGNNRSSGRFSRHGTQRSTTALNLTRNNNNNNNNSNNNNGIPTSVRITSGKRIKRNRAPSPGPCVYYPARDVQRTQTVITPSSSLHFDCYNKNGGMMTSGF